MLDASRCFRPIVRTPLRTLHHVTAWPQARGTWERVAHQRSLAHLYTGMNMYSQINVLTAVYNLSDLLAQLITASVPGLCLAELYMQGRLSPLSRGRGAITPKCAPLL